MRAEHRRWLRREFLGLRPRAVAVPILMRHSYSLACRRHAGPSLSAPKFMAFPTPPAILAARNLRAADLEKSPADTLFQIYAWTHLARITDNRILELFRQGLLRGTVTGGQGNEG